MDDKPAVTICMTTFFKDKQRKEVAENTLESWVNDLKYSGELRLCICDDGSTLDWHPKNIWKGPIKHLRQERHGVGASLNAGFKEAYKTSPLVLYAVDDWCLLEPIDITPWCKALVENKNMGIIRLGPPHPFMRGTVEIVSEDWQGWALKCDRYSCGVGHRPEIFHKRFTDYYGWWAEDVNACEVERLATVKWANDPSGPDIYLALPHKWQHIDSISLSELEP
jgi:hypothetical protein